MKILWRFMLVACLALIGMAAGAWIGGHFLVSKGSGLAGAPIALGYGLLGAFAFVVVGFIAAFRLKQTALPNAALFSALAVALVYGALTYQAMSKAAASREPDSAFAAVGNFTVTMERLDLSDPGLFVKMQVNSQSRKWTLTGPPPKHMVCSAKMRAKSLVGLRGALDALVTMDDDVLADCRTAKGPANKRLYWDVEGEKNMLNISAACEQNYYPIARILALIESASSTSASKVNCK